MSSSLDLTYLSYSSHGRLIRTDSIFRHLVLSLATTVASLQFSDPKVGVKRIGLTVPYMT